MRSLLLSKAFYFTFAVILCIVGCAFGSITVDDLDQSLMDIQKIVSDSLPMGKRAVSPNGREFFSEYFVLVESKARTASKAQVRYYAHIYILGDQRPYQVKGLVRKEVREKTSSGYEYYDAGEESRLSSLMMKKLKARLTRGREERNVIDDFRVF